MSKKNRQNISGQVMETSDYKKFELLPFNRDVARTRRLRASMLQHGWISAYPMYVVKQSNGQLGIKAGHRRFVVARDLGIPVKYVICKDTATIFELESGTTR